MRRSIVLGVIAVVAAVVVAVGGALALALGRSRIPARAGAAPSTPGVTVPAGWQRVSSLGVQLAVPGSWQVGNDAGCDGPDSVVRGGGAVRTIGCVGPARPSRTIVTIAPTSRGGTPPGARRPEGIEPDRVWRSTDDAVVVTGSGADHALLDRVFATLQEVRVDWAGCPTRFARPAWDRPRPAPVVPGADVASVVVCLYDSDLTRGRLAASTVLRGTSAADVVTALRRAPAGPNPDQPESVCLRGSPESFVATLQLVRTETSTPAVLHFSACTGRHVTTPTGTSQVTALLLDASLRALRVGYVYGSSGVPRG